MTERLSIYLTRRLADAATDRADRAKPDPGLSGVIEELAARHGDKPALISDRETFTYRELGERSPTATPAGRWRRDSPRATWSAC